MKHISNKVVKPAISAAVLVTAGLATIVFFGCESKTTKKNRGMSVKPSHAADDAHDEKSHDDHDEERGEGQEDGDQDDHGDEKRTPVQVKLRVEVQRSIGLATAKVKRHPLPAELQTTGEVDFNLDKLAHVSARLSGRVENVKKTLGDDVKRGTWLVVLDSIELGQAKADYLQSKAMEDVARRSLAREEALLKDKIASQRAVYESRGRHLTAVSKMNVAREKLRLYGLSDETIAGLKFGDPGASSLAVRAPIGGRIVDKHVTHGELVTPEKSLFTIADLSALWVWIDLFERDLPLVHVGDDVAIVADAVPGRTFIGKIGYIRDEVDRDTRAVRARIDVDNPERNLKPGMFTTVQIADPHGIDGASTAKHGLAVPIAALIREGETRFLFVRKGPETFEQRRVTLGRRSGHLVEVLDGVSEGENVIIKGAFFLKSEANKSSLSESEHSH